MLSLYFIRGFAHFKDIPFIQNNLTEVFRKIKVLTGESKPGERINFFKRLSSLFVLPRELGGKVYIEKSRLNFLEKLIEAALDYRVCELTHGIGKNEKRYKFGPLHFFNYRDAIYILSKNMTMAFHRVKDIKVLENEYFEYPSGFDVDRYFEKGLFNFEEEKHTIKLRFLPNIREYILEREWYPNQKQELMKDGSVILSFKSDLNMILIGWIRGFGSEVSVLEPRELRQYTIKDLRKNLKGYKD